MAAAALAADKMAEAIGDAGEVGVIVHDQTSRTGIDRRDGFVNRMKAKHPNIKIVERPVRRRRPPEVGRDRQGDDLRRTRTSRASSAPTKARPNGAAIGVKESGKKVVLIGYDSGKEQKDEIRSGLMFGAITQNPIGIGKCTVDSAVKALKGEKLPKVIDTGFYWYDKSNIDDPKIAAVLYD